MSTKITFEDNSRQILSEADRKIGLILTAIGLKAVTIWQKLITIKKVVDTGEFRRDCQSEPNLADKSVTIGNVKEYATHLEIGTSRMKARPTLKPTILEYKGDYEKLAKNIWQQ